MSPPSESRFAECGQTSAAGHADISGDALALYQQLDGMFLRWARASGAKQYQFPGVIAARHLQRLDYFSGFPHIVSFPVALARTPENLRGLNQRMEAEPAELGELTAPELVLTPAACYHFYPALEGRVLTAPEVLTTRGHCYRSEEYYRPLERQWQFSMREIVCVADADTVAAFIEDHRAKLQGWIGDLGLPVTFEVATDPFYRPERQPKALAQRIDPVKTEIIYKGSLAIGSLNLHRNFFGERFSITYGDGYAFSGCVAFGLERWLFAMLDHFGTRAADWPDLTRIGPGVEG